jgi:hypothetical protein
MLGFFFAIATIFMLAYARELCERREFLRLARLSLYAAPIIGVMAAFYQKPGGRDAGQFLFRWIGMGLLVGAVAFTAFWFASQTPYRVTRAPVTTPKKPAAMWDEELDGNP